MVLISQNGWQAATTYTGHGIPLVPLRWVTGSVRSGDVHTVLDHLGERFHREVEPIDKGSSWGFAPRQIRGTSTTLSNHASGTAVDFNAPRHGIGLSGTFSPQQRRAIERILSDLAGTVRWGGHYTGRKDEMHFEINCTPAQLARVADKIRKGNATTAPATKTAAPAPAAPPPPKETPVQNLTLIHAPGKRAHTLIAPGYARVLANSEELQLALKLNGVDIKDKLNAREYDVYLDLAMRPSAQAASQDVLEEIRAQAVKSITIVKGA